MKLTPSDVLSLFRAVTGSPKLPPKLTMLLPPSRPAHLKFASLLSEQTSVHTIAPDQKTHESAQSLGLKSTLAPPNARDAPSITRFAAWNAIKKSHCTVVLPETAYDQALSSLATRLGALPASAPSAPGCEMLPKGALNFVRPLLSVPPDVLGESPPPLGVDLDAAAEHGAIRLRTSDVLHEMSDELLRESVLEASHWGYLVIRRSTLAHAYSSSGGGERLVALDAMARAMAYVSGGSEALPPTAEHVSRVAATVLGDGDTGPPPLPKGRTAAGMVVRRATGRFARRVAQADAQRRRRQRDRSGGSGGVKPPQDDLMILTREPDHEGTGLLARRLGGNAACRALQTDGSVYWDNRYVMLAAPVAELETRDSGAVLDDAAVLEAALRAPDGAGSGGHDASSSAEIRAASLYVRQLRRADWERITAATERVRSFQVPFECIRALPGVFEKSEDSSDVGLLAASPHLGLTSRSDLFFTAVRVPRYRTLPDDLCPGFVLQGERERRSNANVTRKEQHGGSGYQPKHRKPSSRIDEGLKLYARGIVRLLFSRVTYSSFWRLDVNFLIICVENTPSQSRPYNDVAVYLEDAA
eukprot:IDg15880t1